MNDKKDLVKIKTEGFSSKSNTTAKKTGTTFPTIIQKRRTAVAQPSGNRNRRKSRMGTERAKGEEKDRWLAGLLIKGSICAAICLIVLLIKVADTPVAREITGGIKSVLTYNIDIDETLGKLKYVDNTISGVQEVFGEDNTMIAPVNAQISSDFSDSNSGMVFAPTDGKEVWAAAGGEVEAVGRDEELGDYVFINHGASISSRYYNLMEITVQEGDTVQSGQKIGTAGEQLTFQVMSNGQRVDPVEYLGQPY